MVAHEHVGWVAGLAVSAGVGAAVLLGGAAVAVQRKQAPSKGGLISVAGTGFEPV